MRVKVRRTPGLRWALYELCCEMAAVNRVKEAADQNVEGAKAALEMKLLRLEGSFIELIESHVET